MVSSWAPAKPQNEAQVASAQRASDCTAELNTVMAQFCSVGHVLTSGTKTYSLWPFIPAVLQSVQANKALKGSSRAEQRGLWLRVEMKLPAAS